MIERIYTYDQIKTLILNDYVNQNLTEIRQEGLDKKGSADLFTQTFINVKTGEIEYIKVWIKKIENKV